MTVDETRTHRAPRRTPTRARAHRAWLAGSLGILSQLGAPLLASDAAAQEAQAPSLPEAADDERAAPGDRTQVLEDRIQELNERLSKAEEERQKAAAPAFSWNGYVDFGLFAPLGNRGAGWVRDDQHTQFPQYSNYSWVFLGDILSTAVNSRGEVADLGDATGLAVPRYDGINSDGAAGFILNEINLRPRYQLSDRAILRASVNFVPRTGSDFALGDSIDADLGELEYLMTADGKTSIFAGKTLPVFGIEYKDRKSDQRFGITPSLVSRYTTGSQLGLKVRSKLLDDWLIVAASITNNSSTIEMFHFYSETDKNNGKTLNGRAAVSLPVGHLMGSDDRLEIGFSGEWGPQDRATNNAGKMWFAGVDLQYLGTSFWVKGQLLEGKSPGRPDEGVWGLDLKPSGYLEIDWLLLASFGLMARAEFRDALVTLGTDRLYITKEARFTAGIHVVVNPHIVVRAEYLRNVEYGGIDSFDNDVATSSLVLAF